MIINMRHGVGVVLLAMLTLLHGAATSQAQCKGGQRLQNISRQQNGLGQQLQQLLQMQQQNTLVGLQQQQNGLIGQQPQSSLLIALRQQRQQNGFLIALDNKQRNSAKGLQTTQVIGFPTALENQQFLSALQTALEQTQYLLTALAQQNAIANQNAWLNALQRQSTLLTALSQQYGDLSSN